VRHFAGWTDKIMGIAGMLTRLLPHAPQPWGGAGVIIPEPLLAATCQVALPAIAPGMLLQAALGHATTPQLAQLASSRHFSGLVNVVPGDGEAGEH
jgi:hypothetical protein